MGPLENPEAFLDERELARAGRFRFERDRKRFAFFRAAIRLILGRYVGRPPRELRFAYSPEGKPSLAGRPADDFLEFNLAHSEDVALLAVGRGRRIGVDLERIRDERDTDEIAERFFSRDEVRALRALAPDQRRKAFFSCWTRKEAYVKARGDGLSMPLSSFSMSLAPREAAELRSSDLGEGGDLALVPGRRGDGPRIRRRRRGRRGRLASPPLAAAAIRCRPSLTASLRARCGPRSLGRSRTRRLRPGMAR